jgi:DNA-directed RNA polymerase specialized sigma subunit
MLRGDGIVKMTISENLGGFNFKETKNLVSNYFMDLEKLKWEQARLNVQQGLTAKYDISDEDKKPAYIVAGKDEFNLSAKAEKSEELRKHLSGYYWAKSILSEQEQLYITEYFVNGKYEDEVVELLGFSRSDSRAYRSLKRKAIYKFAYVLNLVV